MLPPPTLLEAMSPFPFFLDASATLERAEAMFEEHGIRHLPIKHEGELVGLLTTGDVAVARRLGHARRVGEICHRDILTVDVHLPLAAVLATMIDQHADCALVIKHEHLVGIFTTTDACRLLAEVLGGPADPAPIVA